MGQVFTALMTKGFIGGHTTLAINVWPVWNGEVDVLSAYPTDGVPGVEIQVRNIRYQRYVEGTEWRWRLLFDLANLSGNSVVFEVHWSRMFS